MDALAGYAAIARVMQRNDGEPIRFFSDPELERLYTECQNEKFVVSDWVHDADLSLEIDGKPVGSLLAPDKRLIRSAGKPAMFGKGSETVHDESVRKALDIPADRFRIFRKGRPFMNLANFYEIGSALTDLFGCKTKCVPYKLNVYEPGDFFLPHLDTVRDPKHVGTVVVWLRSKYEGGDLVVWLDDKEENESFRFSDEEDIHFVAFPTDAQHEIKPVTDGFRITLACNVIVRDPDDSGSDSDCDSDDGEGQDYEHVIAEKWSDTVPSIASLTESGDDEQAEAQTAQLSKSAKAKIDRFINCLSTGSGRKAFILRHLYSKAALTENCLKGADRLLVAELRKRWPDVVLAPIIVTATKERCGPEVSVSARCVHRNLLTDSKAQIDDLFERELPPKKRYKPTELLVLNSPGSAWLLKHKRGAEYTGNESAPDEYVYWLSVVIVDLD